MYYTFNPHKNLRSVGDFFSHSAGKETGTEKSYVAQDHNVCGQARI